MFPSKITPLLALLLIGAPMGKSLVSPSSRISSLSSLDQDTKQHRVVSIRGGASELHMSFPLANMYGYALNNHYLATQSCTFAFFCGLGDAIAQRMTIQKNKENDGPTKNDWKRTAKFFSKGLGCGVLWTYWYRLNETWSSSITTKAIAMLNLVNVQERTKVVIHTISSILLEQFVASPIIYGLWDIPVLTMLLEKSVREVPGAVKAKLGKLLVANAKLWTFANIIIYNVPLKWRVIVLSGFDLVWQSILSTIAVDKVTTDEESDAEDMYISELLSPPSTDGNSTITAKTPVPDPM